MYNFIYYLLFTFYVISCFLLIALILIQKGKGGMGIGTMGGGTQMLFGGSGGQDFFQKFTWVLGVVLMAGSLILGMLKSSTLYNVKYMPTAQPAQAHELLTDSDLTAPDINLPESSTSTESTTAAPAA